MRPFPSARYASPFPRSVGGHHGTIFAVSSVWRDMAQPAADGLQRALQIHRQGKGRGDWG